MFLAVQPKKRAERGSISLPQTICVGSPLADSVDVQIFVAKTQPLPDSE